MENEGQNVSEKDLNDLARMAVKESEVAAFDQMLRLPIPHAERVGAYLISAFLLAVVGLMAFGKANVIVQAEGRIRPVENTFQIESQESGVVLDVTARPGDRLEEGAPIVTLDASEKGLDLAQAAGQLALLRERLERMKETARVADRILEGLDRSPGSGEGAGLSGKVLESFVRLKTAWLNLNNAKKFELKALDERLDQTGKEIELEKEKLEALRKELAQEQKRLKVQESELDKKQTALADLEKLAGEGYYSRVEVEREQSALKEAVRALDDARQGITERELAIANEKIKLNDLANQGQKTGRERIKTVQDAEMEYEMARIDFQESRARLDEDIQSLVQEIEAKEGGKKIRQSQMEKTVIRMPFSGVIGDMKINNVGQMVSPGDAVALAFPADSPMEALVRIPNKDIGLIRSGTPASVKIHAFSFKDFGSIPAEVKRVAPNVSGEGGFFVVLGLKKQALEKDGQIFSLFPGLTLDADLLTRQIRLYQLVFKNMDGMKTGGEEGPPAEKKNDGTADE